MNNNNTSENTITYLNLATENSLITDNQTSANLQKKKKKIGINDRIVDD